MRKLWFSISYKRIAATLDKYGALDEAHHGFVPNRGTDSGFLDLLNQLEKAQEWGYQHYYAMLMGCQTSLRQCQSHCHTHGIKSTGGPGLYDQHDT